MAAKIDDKLTPEVKELVHDYVTKVTADANSFALAISSGKSQLKVEPTNDEAKSDTTPLLKDLYGITPQCATDWRAIGGLLGIPKEELKIIEHDNHHKAVPCCYAMWEKWLEVDINASWSKLQSIIHSSAASSNQGVEKGEQSEAFNKPLQEIPTNPVNHIQMERKSLDNNKCYCGKPTVLNKVNDINSENALGNEYYRCSSKRCPFRNVIWWPKSKKIIVVCHCQLEARKMISANRKPYYICPEEYCRFLIWEKEIGSGYTVLHSGQRKLTDYGFNFKKCIFKRKKNAEGQENTSEYIQ